MTEDIDIVNGIKIGQGDPLYRVVIGHLYNFIFRNLFNIDIFDVDCDFRLIRRKMLQGINLTASSGAICTELVKKPQLKGARFREVSVHNYPRTYGRSQFFNLKRVSKTGMELLDCDSRGFYYGRFKPMENLSAFSTPICQLDFYSGAKEIVKVG
jgi:hypothetical protein